MPLFKSRTLCTDNENSFIISYPSYVCMGALIDCLNWLPASPSQAAEIWEVDNWEKASWVTVNLWASAAVNTQGEECKCRQCMRKKKVMYLETFKKNWFFEIICTQWKKHASETLIWRHPKVPCAYIYYKIQRGTRNIFYLKILKRKWRRHLSGLC